ncbi:MAG: tryptophan--tRNA ligase [Oscillospiraceae bacterium]|jgi:tryptophanyl-tRNA synthetase|nr:tryptophan--tRNA ligase [Oscillospiraceae bacterium]
MPETARPAGKPVIYSGIQPSGTLTIGNYIGSLSRFKQLEADFDCLFCVVDMHAITVRQDPAQLRGKINELAALYLAVGLDPGNTILYCQSHVPAHAELAWVLDCFTYMGELQRMTQFKDKSARHEDNINAGLFTYPVLMAADILLYQTSAVPVGADQKQHLEIARDIAIRFNNIYGNVFVVPEPYIPKIGAKILSLQDPSRKMSKSDPEDTFIGMLDPPEVIRRKMKRAVTDSGAEVRFDPDGKPGVSNLITMLSILTGRTIASVEGDYVGKGYGALKADAAEACVETLAPIQAEHRRWLADLTELNRVLKDGADRASRIAARTMGKVRRKVGLAPLN